MIHNLSFPFGASVNDFIPPEFCSVHYATVNDAIRIIKRLGAGCTLAKTDVRSAFRIIPVNPLDYQLLPMQWKGRYYVDGCLPMGCASSCKTFEALSTAMEWIARNKLAISNILHILDDFLILIHPTMLAVLPSNGFYIFVRTLGFPWLQKKTEGPSQLQIKNLVFCKDKKTHEDSAKDQGASLKLKNQFDPRKPQDKQLTNERVSVLVTSIMQSIPSGCVLYSIEHTKDDGFPETSPSESPNLYGI
ncbi:hypothetical protein ACROYT_G001259 [Oculina patagonica]